MPTKYEATYKGFKLMVEETEWGWQPSVIVIKTGEAMTEVKPGQNNDALTGATFVPFGAHKTIESAKQKACQEATRRAGGIERTCADVRIEWSPV